MSATISFALVAAGIIFVLGSGISLLMILAASMSDSPTAAEGAAEEAGGMFIVTCLVTLALVALHYLPIHWTM